MILAVDDYPNPFACSRLQGWRSLLYAYIVDLEVFPLAFGIETIEVITYRHPGALILPMAFNDFPAAEVFQLCM